MAPDTSKIKQTIAQARTTPRIGIVLVIVVATIVMLFRFAGVSNTTTVYAHESNEAQEEPQETVITEPSYLWVHVSGAVASPGVYQLPAGSRVSDAIRSAGGLREEAKEASVNQARVLSDGEQIYIAFANEASNNAGVFGQATDVNLGGKININSASQAELQTLNGIGEALAKRIVAYRESKGPFTSIEDLMKVSGIGAKKFESISSDICV